jgi:hypothetical protein
MNKLSPRQQAACDVAKAQRRLCRDWLIYIMTASSEKTRTKADLRAEATKSRRAHLISVGCGQSRTQVIIIGTSRRKKIGTMLT